jgi:glucokinase
MRASTQSDRPFIVVSGLPGSGKSTLAQRLAPLLDLTVIDKDEILERLFEERGIGDKAWRRQLSRESDEIFQAEAVSSPGAILVSFWRLPGMPLDTGTPTGWLPELSNRVLNLHCICPPDIAAERWFRRRRHPGHLDAESSFDEIKASIQANSLLGAPAVEPRIEVETSRGQLQLDVVARKIMSALNGPFLDAK